MKLWSSLVFLASVLLLAAAQTIAIGSPSTGDPVSPNAALNVQILCPNSIIGCQEVAIVISMAQCTNSTSCTDPSERLGTPLYIGPFNPQPPPSPPFVYQQNFTVTVPEYLEDGSSAILSLTHLCLLGAGPFPLLEFRNVTLSVV